MSRSWNCGQNYWYHSRLLHNWRCDPVVYKPVGYDVPVLGALTNHQVSLDIQDPRMGSGYMPGVLDGIQKTPDFVEDEAMVHLSISGHLGVGVRGIGVVSAGYHYQNWKMLRCIVHRCCCEPCRFKSNLENKYQF